jgi:hypothetical protein
MKDLAGYPFNAKYPPNYELNGGLYHGYKNNSEETFFYDFAVQRYDLRFSYNGVEYYFMSGQDYAAQCDEKFTNKIRKFKDGNAVLEEFEIDGKRLIDLIPLIEDCEPM